jgi:Replication protein P
MVVIYADQWVSRNGLLHENGKYTAAAQEWLETLAGLTNRQIKSGFDALRKNGEEWPPNAIRFRKLCLSSELEGVPSIDEVYNILAFNKNKEGSIKDRFKHPLVFRVSELVDIQTVRGYSLKIAINAITPVYNRVIKEGWPDWKPEHLLNPLLIEQKKAGKEQWNKNFANLREQIRLR